MEDVEEPPDADMANGSAAADRVAAGGTSTAHAPTAPSASDLAHATTQDGASEHSPSSDVLDGDVQPVDTPEDVVQPLPVSKPVRSRAMAPKSSLLVCMHDSRTQWP